MPTKTNLKDKKALATTSFIIGIVVWGMLTLPAVAVTALPESYAAGLINEILGAAAIVLALVGIIFGAISLNSSRPRFAAAGLTMGIIMVVLTVFSVTLPLVSMIAQIY